MKLPWYIDQSGYCIENIGTIRLKLRYRSLVAPFVELVVILSNPLLLLGLLAAFISHPIAVIKICLERRTA